MNNSITDEQDFKGLSDLLPIIDDKVSSYDLWNALGCPNGSSNYTKWIKQYLLSDYAFIKGSDFSYKNTKTSSEKGGRPIKEYELSIECAKAISMLQKTDLGNRVRRYLIRVEELLINGYNAELDRLQEEREKNAPKVEFYDRVYEMEATVRIRDFVYHLRPITGEVRFFKWLRSKGYLNSKNIPYQKYIDRGYFRVNIINIQGVLEDHPQPLITGKGIIFLSRRWMEDHVNKYMSQLQDPNYLSSLQV